MFLGSEIFWNTCQNVLVLSKKNYPDFPHVRLFVFIFCRIEIYVSIETFLGQNLQSSLQTRIIFQTQILLFQTNWFTGEVRR